MARQDGSAEIPLDKACRDDVSRLTPEQFGRTANAGEIDLPRVRIEVSRKAARGAA